MAFAFIGGLNLGQSGRTLQLQEIGAGWRGVGVELGGGEILGCSWGGEGVLQYNTPVTRMDYHHANEILRSPQGHALFIGDCSAAEDVGWLHEQNVRTVLTAAAGFHFRYDSSIRHITYELQDNKSEHISAHFDLAAFQIEKNLKHGSVLVHCGAGVSRSPTLVIAYLLKYAGMSFLPALKLCQCKRPQVCPNLGFELQLKAYEKQLQKGSQSVKKKSSELPELGKYQPFSTHNNRSFLRVSREGRDSNSTLSKSLKAGEIRERKEMDCLRKMAEFRFGITNIANWKMNTGSVHKHVHF